ncbi:MAG: alpha-L-fucosidase [Anaerolineae bacterium]|nr:alpha-L-fucosidase [Anaerolineae bacterium]
MTALPFRQVHLDFHTSPHIPEVGADFNADEFIATLQDGHVNSVTVFAKCHHGYSYYPTQVGTVHPSLKRDLLGEMVEACHQAGIRVAAYTTVTWDELAWETHPEWRQFGVDGAAAGPSHTPLRPGWKNLCMNTGYGDYVIAQCEEIIQQYDVAELFIDITRYIGGGCVCSTCRAQMIDQGVDPEDPQQLALFTLNAERRFIDRCTAAIQAIKPEMGIFYNSRLNMEYDPALGNRSEMDNFTHLEIESLPGGEWGYDHFPMYARYYQDFDEESLAMTGRFHTTWGDFGGLRNQAALAFESFQGLAHGAKISIGDQLHPRGRLEPAVYRRIGEVYAEVEQREPWCEDTTSLPEIGVFTASGSRGMRGARINGGDVGALHALEQLKQQFAFLDAGSDLSPYSVIVITDQVAVDAELADRLREYVNHGGKLLVSLGRDSYTEYDDFALADLMGAYYDGPAPFAPDYLMLADEISGGIEPMPHSAQLPGVKLRVEPGTTVLAYSGAPYFNRTWRHFCSHQYTPLERTSDEPIIIQKGSVLTIARPLFSEYGETSKRVHKQVIANCLSRLLPAPRVGAHNLPSTAIVTVRQQAADLIVHLLHYVHQRRGKTLDIIEDVIPLHDVEVSIRSASQPSAVRLQPEGEDIPFTYADGYVHVQVPQVNGYQIVQLVGARP